MDDVVRLSESSKYKWIFDLVDVSHKFIMLKNFEGEVIYINNVLLRLLGFNHDDIGENYDFFLKISFLMMLKKLKRIFMMLL
jgi:hypothetical protein